MIIREVNVLVIEDDEVAAMILENFLIGAKIAKFDIEVVGTLQEGKDALNRERFDVILFDLNLPDSDSANTLQYIDEISHRIPIVIMTSTDDDELAIRSLNLGVQDYLTKGKINEVLFRRAIIYAMERHRLARELEAEKKKSDKLLLNILPLSVAEELKIKGKALTSHYEFATVMFADFTNFTQISETLHPEILVKELDYCFGKFDLITEALGVEKIKTIGDAYLCVGGIPEPDPHHPVQVLRAAFQIRDFIRQRKTTMEAKGLDYWDVRIGVHSGPLTAGVVGKRKFAYDIWGDTVNTAARLESHGKPGRINVSQQVFEQIRHAFDCTHRGEIRAKGKGKMDMYFVEALRSDFTIPQQAPALTLEEKTEELRF